MRRVASWFVVLTLGIATASAQEAAPKKSFEVASIKASAPLDPQKIMSGQQRVGMKTDAGRVDIENWSILELLNAAYKVSPTRLTGPGWPGPFNQLTASRFDIHATFPPGATKDDVPEMLQSLLAERWKLALHHEQKEQQVLALIVGKDGPKLQPSPAEAPADAANNTNRPDPIQVSGDPQKGMTIRGAGQAGAMKMNMTPDGMIHMTAERLTMAQLADSLVPLVGRPVVDQTGLTGNYQVAFELSQADVLAAARAAGMQIPGAPGAGAGGAGPATGAADPSGGTSAYQSVEKMGLKLEQRKASVDYTVIDRLEKAPTED
jgi:uncharacterized protein (TIGR03435 family)